MSSYKAPYGPSKSSLFSDCPTAKPHDSGDWLPRTAETSDKQRGKAPGAGRRPRGSAGVTAPSPARRSSESEAVPSEVTHRNLSHQQLVH